MKNCSVKPYEGMQKYIFISYCHKDSRFVFPIIEQMVKDGYRVWYDEGIDPGSEWPEIIAEHLNACSACIAFISENSLASHNCRREINFALLKKKSFISIILEPVQMSLGMEMQLSATQSIFKFSLPDERNFFSKLYDANFLHDCLGSPNPAVIVSKSSDYDNDDNADRMFAESSKPKSHSDSWFLDEKNCGNKEKSVPEKNPESQSVKVESDSLENSSSNVINKPEIKPVISEKNPADECIKSTEIAKGVMKFWLNCMKTGENIYIYHESMKIGRSASMSDYVIAWNSCVGRYHARIIKREDNCYLIDNNSKNKTYIGATELKPDCEYLLHDNDIIRFANELFIFHQERSVKI